MAIATLLTLGQSQVVPYVTGLASLGFRMRLISFEKPESLQDTWRVGDLHESLRDVGVEWSPLRYHRRWSLGATGYDVLRGIWAGLASHRESPIRLVHARSYVARVIARSIAKRTAAPWIFDMRSFLVDERIETGLWAKNSLVVKFARAAERGLLANADALIHLTHQGARLAHDLAPGVELPRASVIPTCVDLERFAPVSDPDEIRRRLRIGRGPVLIYIGSLSTWYLAELTLLVGDAFVRRTGGSFVVLTRELDYVRNLCDRLGVQPILESVEYGRVPEWLAMADSGLALVSPDNAKRASAPTKVGEYLACGLTVAATAGVGDLDDQFRDSSVAVTVAPSDGAARIADKVIETLKVPGRRAEARALAESHYDLQSGLRELATLYNALGVAMPPQRP